MDAARYASMSDHDRNPNFRRRWDAPPLKSKCPQTGGTVERAKIDYETNEVCTIYINRIFDKFKHESKIEVPR
jgi:hypothetical protein